jgi:Flp pilus assembly protein TadG
MLTTLRTVRRGKRRGFILVTYTLMLVAMLGMVGLGVDAGTLYVIKGRLSSAVDGAALAAGRSVNLGSTLSAAQTQATSTATQYFNANFPSGFLGTGTANFITPTFTQQQDAQGNPTGILTISVSASVPAPAYFMQLFGFKTINVAASGTASRRATVLILVLDVSSSMNAGSPTACNTMKSSAKDFITNFSPYDTIGAVIFDYTASVLYAPSNTWGDGTLKTALGNITCQNNTNTTSGLYLAYEQIKSVGLPLAYNSIILFTDGSPNGISANFPVRTQSDVRYGHDVGGSCPSLTATCTMPVICSGSPATFTGTMVQGSGQTDTGYTTGLWRPINTDAWAVYPSNCSSNFPSEYLRQAVAYIPDFDKYGNSTHGVPATSTPPTCPGSTCTVATVTLKSSGATYTYDTRDFWEYQVNNACSGATGSAATYCASDSTPNQQYEGGVWASFPNPPTLPSSGSNFFTSGPYKGYLRPDQPNTVVAASMNTAMSEAYWIRADASGCGTNGTACSAQYNTTINTIYLLGNAGDQADHEFLAIMANAQQIPALPYDSSWTVYTNPAFQQDQAQGIYQVTADKTQLAALFQKLASQVLRLSQ